MVGFAVMLALAAAWLLGAETARSTAVARLINRDGVTPSASQRMNSCLAARMAVARGDLWTECAGAYDIPSAVEDSGTKSGSEGSADMAREASERVASWAPFQSKVWLRLASTEARLDWLNRRAVEALRMSFYTGPNEIELIPRRLLVSVQPDMLADPDIERLVRHDIRVALTHAPNVKPAIIAAYRHASPQGKRLLEAAIAEVDADFVHELQSVQPSDK
jgi:hypothetical protein